MMTDKAPALRGCVEACRRCQTLVEHVIGADDPMAAFGAIGPHLRHCLDHFRCLLRGLETGLVDYDARDRSVALETDPEAFRTALAGIVDRFDALGPEPGRRTLRIRQTAASGAATVTVESSLERELVFLSGHTIHHLAIMKLVAERHGVRVPDQLDYAFSTEAHLESAS